MVFPFPRLLDEDLQLIRRSLEDGSFAPLIDSVRPLDEIVDAARYAESGQKIGSVVLVP